MGNFDSSFSENPFALLMVIGILVMLALALAFVLFVNFSQKKILKEQMQNQKQAYQHQEDLLHSTILTQEEERKRIAKDLHDEIGSKLNIIFLNIHRLKQFNHLDEQIVTITDEVDTLIHTTIATTRRISHDLLPPTLENFGLVEAIKELQYHFRQTGKLHFIFDHQAYEKKIDDQLMELNLYRVLQELLNNSIRHGQADAVQVHLSADATAIKMKYRDNGIGFDLAQLEHQKGLGRKNIQSRLHMIKAEYQYESAPSEGMSLYLEIKNDRRRMMNDEC